MTRRTLIVTFEYFIYRRITFNFIIQMFLMFFLIGRYYYIDVSMRTTGDNASLASATLSQTTTCKMTFWYNMNGIGIGSLSVSIATEFGIPSNMVWAKSGDQGFGWQKASFILNSLKDFQVIVTAEAGVSNRGDIGIDDVIFSPECKFNGNLLPGLFLFLKDYFHVFSRSVFTTTVDSDLQIKNKKP